MMQVTIEYSVKQETVETPQFTLKDPDGNVISVEDTFDLAMQDAKTTFGEDVVVTDGTTTATPPVPPAPPSPPPAPPTTPA